MSLRDYLFEWAPFRGLANLREVGRLLGTKQRSNTLKPFHAMIDTCERLAEHVRANLPPANGITCLKAHDAHGFVSFRWYERDFVVKKSLEVFEVKGQNLFVTGASILLQAVLAKANYDSKIVEAVVSSIRQVEDLMGEEDQRDSGFQLLSTVRDTLKKLSRQPVENLRPGALKSNPLIGSISPPQPAEPAVAEI